MLKFRGLRVPTKIYSPQKFLSIGYIDKVLIILSGVCVCAVCGYYSNHRLSYSLSLERVELVS